jgi:hypothetical protein
MRLRWLGRAATGLFRGFSVALFEKLGLDWRFTGQFADPIFWSWIVPLMNDYIFKRHGVEFPLRWVPSGMKTIEKASFTRLYCRAVAV